MINKKFICGLLCITILGFSFKANYFNSSVKASESTSELPANLDKQYFENTSYFDIDGDGADERIVKRISNDTSEALSYYIYKNNSLIWSREEIYKGSVTIQKNLLIETTPIYAKDDSNSSPSKTGQTTYTYDSKNNSFINTGYQEYSMNNCPNIVNATGVTYSNPSKEKIKTILDEVADEKGIPRAIMEAIAWQESKAADSDNGGITNWRQFSNGAPLIGYDGIGIGIMQVSDYDKNDTSATNLEYINRLKYDIEFNIREGANILLTKWSLAYSSPIYKTPKIGNMETNYLEHWYYAIWAYNSYSNLNNPANNYNTAYQTLVINHVKNVFSTAMTDLYLYDNTLFTKDVLPRTDIAEINSSSLNSATLKVKNAGTTYVSDTASLNLRDGNMALIGTFAKGVPAIILSGPTYSGGYSRYNVQVGNLTGSVADMYLKPSGEYNYDSFVDIYDLVQLSKQLNTAVIAGNAQDIRKYDINNDNTIDIKDLALAGQNYNKYTIK